MSLNPFPVRYLRPEVELMYLLRMRSLSDDIIRTKVAENDVAHPKCARLYRTRAHREMRYPNVT